MYDSAPSFVNTYLDPDRDPFRVWVHECRENMGPIDFSVGLIDLWVKPVKQMLLEILTGQERPVFVNKQCVYYYDAEGIKHMIIDETDVDAIEHKQTCEIEHFTISWFEFKDLIKRLRNFKSIITSNCLVYFCFDEAYTPWAPSSEYSVQSLDLSGSILIDIAQVLVHKLGYELPGVQRLDVLQAVARWIKHTGAAKKVRVGQEWRRRMKEVVKEQGVDVQVG